MFCTQCGTELRSGIKFCTQCGTMVMRADAEKQQKEIGTQIKRNPPAKSIAIGADVSGKLPEQVRLKQKSSAGVGIVIVAVILVFLILAAFGAAFWTLGGRDMVVSLLPNRDDVIALETEESETLTDDQDEQSTADEEAVSSIFDMEEESETEELIEESEKIIVDDEPETSEYILPNSDSRFLTRDDLAGFNAEMCRIARNELYARHGRKFNDVELQAYFNECSWYEGTIEADEFKESELNDYEVANRDLIVEYEKEMGYR